MCKTLTLLSVEAPLFVLEDNQLFVRGRNGAQDENIIECFTQEFFEQVVPAIIEYNQEYSNNKIEEEDVVREYKNMDFGSL